MQVLKQTKIRTKSPITYRAIIWSPRNKSAYPTKLHSQNFGKEKIIVQRKYYKLVSNKESKGGQDMQFKILFSLFSTFISEVKQILPIEDSKKKEHNQMLKQLEIPNTARNLTQKMNLSKKSRAAKNPKAK